MPNQMIALQSRGAKMPDPTAQTAKFVNMMNMTKQQEAAERQASLAQQSMDINKAQEARAVETQTSAQKKAGLEYLKDLTLFYRDRLARINPADKARYGALREKIITDIPAFDAELPFADEWNQESKTLTISKADDVIKYSLATPVASLELGVDNKPRSVVVGGLPGAAEQRPVLDAVDSFNPTSAPRATPTTPPASAMERGSSAVSGAPMTFGTDAERPLNTTQQEDLRNLEGELGMTNTPASFTGGGMGGAGQMTPDVMSRIVDSAFETGVMAQVDFDQLLATQPPENRQAFTDAFQRANVKLQADAPSLAGSGMGQQQMAANPVQRPQAGFANLPPRQLQDTQPMMRQTLAQTRTSTPLQMRNPNVSPIPSPVPAAVLGAQEGAKTKASKDVELEMNPRIAEATKLAERAVEKRSEALVAKNETKTLIQSIDKYIEEIDELLRSPDRRFIVGRIEGNLHYLGSLGQNERQAELQAMFDRVKSADTLGSLVAMKQATVSGGSPVGNASNQDVQLVAKGANSLVQTGGVPKFDADLKKLRRDAYRTRQKAIEFYGDRYGELAASDTKFKLGVKPIADRYISSADLPKPAAGAKTPTSKLSAATRAKYGIE